MGPAESIRTAGDSKADGTFHLPLPPGGGASAGAAAGGEEQRGGLRSEKLRAVRVAAAPANRGLTPRSSAAALLRDAADGRPFRAPDRGGSRLSRHWTASRSIRDGERAVKDGTRVCVVLQLLTSDGRARSASNASGRAGRRRGRPHGIPEPECIRLFATTPLCRSERSAAKIEKNY